MNRLTLVALAGALIMGLPHAAAAADLLPPPGSAAQYETYQPCGEARALNRIVHRFDHQVRNVPGLPPVGISSFANIAEHRYLPALPDRPIARRYCNATVWLTDGNHRRIWYLIESGQGFAGMGDNVEFCIDGFDRWNVYDGHCRVLK